MLVLAWSGGKDSVFALRTLREREREPDALLTTVTEESGRVTVHGVPRELVRAQARSVGVPLVEVAIPAVCPNDAYAERMAAALASPSLRGGGTMAFADLFLEDIRAYREDRLAETGWDAEFPLWGRDTMNLATECIDAGFEATLVSVDPRRLDASFAGRRYDHALLTDLPPEVDPCGENGEFHTFVHAGPVFRRPIRAELGETIEGDGFAYCELVPSDAPALARRGA